MTAPRPKSTDSFIAQSLKGALLAGTMLCCLSATAYSQDETEVVVPTTGPNGEIAVYSSYRNTRRSWTDYYWILPEGGSDIHGFCGSQRYRQLSSNPTPQANGSLRAMPNSFCNRSDFGELTPGRAPWDRANRVQAVAVRTAQNDAEVSDRCVLASACQSDPTTDATGRLAIRRNLSVNSDFSLPGDSPDDRIVVRDDIGSDATRDVNNVHSNVVQIRVHTTTGDFNCTGTLINSRQILSAAHCFADLDITGVDIHFDPDGTGITFAAMSVTMHDGFTNGNGWEDDMALVTLEGSALVAEPVELEDSSASHTILGSTVILAGNGLYGNGVDGYTGDDLYRRVGSNSLGGIWNWTEFSGLSGQPLSAAEAASTHNLLFIDFNDPADPTTTIDEVLAAPGDSGGPMFVETSAGLIQIGVLSGGNGAFYGNVAFYQPVAEYADWIEALNPFVDVHVAAGDGLWADENHWIGLEVPENEESDGDFVVTSLPVVPLAYEVFLDQAATTIVTEYELVDTVYVRNEARLEITSDGLLIADSSLILENGSVQVDGVLASQALGLLGGEFTVGVDGAYFDFSPYFDPGTINMGASLHIDGLFLTDSLHQTAGITSVGLTGEYYDYYGTLIEGGGVEIAGLFDTIAYTQLGGYTDIKQSGVLYDVEGFTLFADSYLNVDGELDTIDLFLFDTALSGNGVITAPGGVYQFGGWIDFENANGAGDSLIIDGDYSLIDGALAIGIDATGTDRIMSTGSIALNGDIGFEFFNGYMPLRNSSFTFASADGTVSGDLNILNADPSAVLSYSVHFDSHSAYMSIDAASYASFAETDQQRAVAAALDTAFGSTVPTGDMADMAMAIDYLPTEASVGIALQTSNPSDTFGMDRLGGDLSRSIGDTVSERLSLFAGGDHGGMDVTGLARAPMGATGSGAKSDNSLLDTVRAATEGSTARPYSGMNDRTSVYVRAESVTGEMDLPNGSLDIESTQITLGVDHQVSENWLLGGNITFTDYQADHAIARIDGEAATFTAYAGYASDTVRASAYLGGGSADIDTTRSVLLGAGVMTAEGSTSGDVFNAGFELGADYHLGNLVAGPVARLRHGQSDYDAYGETGAGVFNASLAARDADQTLLGIGGRMVIDLPLDMDQAQIIAQVTWEQDLSGGEPSVIANLEGAPLASFEVTNLNHDDGFASLTLGASFQVNDSLAFAARYRGDFARDTDEENALSVGFSLRF